MCTLLRARRLRPPQPQQLQNKSMETPPIERLRTTSQPGLIWPTSSPKDLELLQMLQEQSSLYAGLQAEFNADYPPLAGLAEPTAAAEHPVLLALPVSYLTSLTAPAATVQAPPQVAVAVDSEQTQAVWEKAQLAAKSMKSAPRSRQTGSRSAVAPRSKKPEMRPGGLNVPWERKERFSKLLRLPAGKPLWMVRREAGGRTATTTTSTSCKAPPLTPQVAHASALSLFLPSELVTIIYKCCILPRMKSETSSSSFHSLMCRKPLFVKHIRLQLIRYFTSAVAKAGNSYKNMDSLVA